MILFYRSTTLLAMVVLFWATIIGSPSKNNPRFAAVEAADVPNASDIKSDECATGGEESCAEASSAVGIFIDSQIGQYKVVVFSKSYCPHCASTKALFKKSEFSKIDIVIHELDKRNDGLEIQKTLQTISGQNTVPSVWVDGKFVGGNSETQKAYKGGKLFVSLGLQKEDNTDTNDEDDYDYDDYEDEDDDEDE